MDIPIYRLAPGRECVSEYLKGGSNTDLLVKFKNKHIGSNYEVDKIINNLTRDKRT